jgi:hypothetical protein
MFVQNRIHEIEPANDIVDRALVISWIASEIAIDVFGTFFWSALGLCLASVLI